ncbi:MAG: DUF4349 domain-containing protein, partial [Actinomycetota bacterium]|nr:DUF4349 domain-containing protein [Actinomycetota bacterium]
SFVAAGVTGLTRSGGGRHALSLRSRKSTTVQHAGAAVDGARAPKARPPSSAAKPYSADLAPNPARLQRYDATLRLRVKDVDALSNATRRAMNLTRSLGGYVGSVQYSTRSGRRGGATLVLRVPIGNVQTALAELTSLGTILQQRTAILDVTRRADRETRQIAKLEAELARIEARLASAPSPELERQAAKDRLALKTLRAKHARLVRSARLARIVLTLTTPAHQAAAAPSRFHRTLDDAGSVLLRELEILLYALVVAGPLLLLGGAGIAAARAQRRRSDRRLLERA